MMIFVMVKIVGMSTNAFLVYTLLATAITALTCIVVHLILSKTVPVLVGSPIR